MRQTRVSVSKRGAVQLFVLIDGIWHGIALDGGEAPLLAAELGKASEKAGRMGG